MTKYIKNTFGEDYHQFRMYKSKSAGAQEAHEAIRPTDFTKEFAGADEQQKKLYNLIWRRTLASQMAPAKLEKTVITITPTSAETASSAVIGKPLQPELKATSGPDFEPDAKPFTDNGGEAISTTLEAKGEILTFDGFLRVYGRSGDDVILPAIASGDTLELASATATENLSRGPARYTEATLVRKLEEMGIGRPSTYASTLSTIQSRGYVERGDVEGTETEINVFELKSSKSNSLISEQKSKIFYGKDQNKLIPTDIGKVVSDFLVKHFAEVMDYDFTKNIENELDDIAEGSKGRVEVLRHFYGPFHRLVEASADVSRAEASQARPVGTDPKSGRVIYARFGRYGAMLQKGENSDDEKPDFAKLPTGTTIDTVTLEQAIEAFKLPRLVGQTADGQDIKANIGRFGPYIQIGKLFVSIKPLDPHDITLEQALEAYAEKLKTEAERNIADFGDGIKILKGRYGPYITDGKKNAKIPKDTEPATITHAQAKKLLKEAPAAKKRSFRRKK